uniref:Transcription initiation factor TFIIA large subunit n=1 Tax=Tetraselmis sp. GSL018 TaxID=582737 RepID=A0A061R7B9_9CHLO
MLPQHDGENCEEDDGEEQEVDDADLENLSDDLSDDEQPGKQDNLVLAQFEKVSRTKTRWKCQLKAGIMHVNGRDYIFNKATGEFQF